MHRAGTNRARRQIQALKPNVTREQALHLFTEGLSGLIANIVRGRPHSITDLYIPYLLFQVHVQSHDKEEIGIYALEAFRGIMDVYELPAMPVQADLLTLETRNVLPSMLDAAQARDAVIAKVRRSIFARGFFQIRDLQIDAVPLPLQICIPYWICFRGNSHNVHISVLDAIRRRKEGPKPAYLIEEWLRSISDTPLHAPQSTVLS